jgi:nucleotide-binding universal stress UspA family protein
VFEKIVCATDFGVPSTSAMRHAAAMARTFGGTLDLVHAWDLTLELPDDRASMRHDVLVASRSTSHAKLDAAVAELSAHGVRATAALVEGRAERAIKAYAEARHADLLVVGSEALDGLARVMLGSVAERLVRTCEVPVLVVPRTVTAAPGGRFAPREIVVPTDLSPGSTEMTRLAAQLSSSTGASLTIVHAWDAPPYYLEDGDAMKATVRRIPEHVEDWLRDTFDETRPKLETIILRGDPNEVIHGLCRVRAPDLVMMATAGRRGLPHFMLGSVTERAIRALALPVMTLRRNG